MYECPCILYDSLSLKQKLNKGSAVAEMGDRFATIDMGQKVGEGAVSVFVEELRPHLTQCRLSRSLSRSLPSGILIHPAVWPQ